jgi:hypothetical protein
MWRTIALMVIAAGCDQGAKRRSYTLVVDKQVALATGANQQAASKDIDDIPAPVETIEHLTTPALAVNGRGLIVAWEMQRRMQEEQSRIVARRISRDLQPIGDVLELGYGTDPAATVRGDEYVLSWTELWADHSITLATVAADGTVAKPTTVRGAPISSKSSLVANGGVVTAVACSQDDQKLVVARETHGNVELEQRPTPGGCNGPIVNGAGRSIVLVQPSELGHTNIMDLGSAYQKPIASPAGYCIDVLNVADVPTLLCLDEVSGTAFSFVRTRRGRPPFNDRIPINVRPTGRVTDARAVTVDQGIILAWTSDVSDKVELSAALIANDGSLLGEAVKLSAAPRLPNFRLVGSGSSAWLAFVTDMDRGEGHEVIVTRLQITGR